MEATAPEPFLVFQGLPIPPTLNHAYATVTIKGVQRRVPGKGLREFKQAFARWEATGRIVYGARVREFLAQPRRPVAVQIVYFFKHEQVWTKDGEPQRMDVANREKSLVDCLSEFIGIDDKWIFDIRQTKAVSDRPHCVVEYRYL